MIAAAPPTLSIRPACAGDQAFVASTFAKQLIRSDHSDANQIVDRVLDSSQTRVIVACDGGRILGWLAYSAIPRVRAVLFVYVRRQARNQGVARELADAAWPDGRGSWVHGGLRGGSTRELLERFTTLEMDLGELL